ncbi:hypothetical protein [Halorubrum sp. DM2]|uniref:DUF7344 domain-containing protein n=1 Tax=Halorubrum sp. DM2 TaxID=2527867 RepID=UPI0031F3242D
MDPQRAFTSIANSRRRRVLLSLSQSHTEISAGDLAVEIAAIEHAIDPSKVGSNKRTSVYVSLIQTHLETLDQSGAVAYDDRSKTVTPTDATEPLAEYIRRLQTACYKPDSEDA